MILYLYFVLDTYNLMTYINTSQGLDQRKLKARCQAHAPLMGLHGVHQ